MATTYVGFVGLSIIVLKEFNSVVTEPYMVCYSQHSSLHKHDPLASNQDEPFHIPQAQAYCRGEFDTWDPKLTTPPGLYILTLVLKKMFMLKCNVAQLRLTTALSLLFLPLVLGRLLAFHQRGRLPRWTEPPLDALILSCFPIAWFFGFLYYTEVPSLVFVVGTIAAAFQGKHWLAALLGLGSCTFRQTNIIWVLYAYAMSQLMYLRFRRSPPGAKPLGQLHDPLAFEARPNDIIKTLLSLPSVIRDILPAFVPYALVLIAFAAFVVWNGGIVLGDKSNHIPTLHVPQMYYFIAFSTAFGWPVLISGKHGVIGLVRQVYLRMFGSKLRILCTILSSLAMAFTVNLFTIHHPFLLSDNRHYTFYVWHRIYMRFPAPYLLIPFYIACAWAWFLRVGEQQTMLQTFLLPIFVLPTLLPTPLLEPRYFLIPYILLRSQVADIPSWSVALEGGWYVAINAATMYVFLYMPREGPTSSTLHPPLEGRAASARFSSPSLFSITMPSDGGSSTPPKAATRSSIRHSLGLASKALAAISKDKEGTKKLKDASGHSRRLSAVDAKPSIALAPRASLGDVNRPSTIAPKRTMTPESKTITRRRVSGTIKEDQQPEQNTNGNGTITRSASLRPRPGVSALPKYRPRSVVGGEKPPSPVRAGTRRRLAGSDEDEDDQASKVVETAVEKSMRPISPLPQRAALKANLSSAINAPSPPVKQVKAAPKAKDTPPRPTKTVRTTPSANNIHNTINNNAIPRPSSSTSSSSSFTPRTPKSTNPKGGASSKNGSPLRSQTESPLARHSKKASSSQLGIPLEAGNMSHISEEGNSEDEEVALLLAPVAPPGAPTPAMPRNVVTSRRVRKPPQTPTRSQLPSRANMSYLSPLPPTNENSPSSLRPKPAGNVPIAGRGSILSWEQLAEASRSLDQDEIAHMLSEMPAPFRSGAVSPVSPIDVPESPCLSAMNSPGEFGSISQVLLPEVTPSPAPHANHSRLTEKDIPAVDPAVVTLLRLQLASVENTAKERLHQLNLMEEEIHNLKQARMRDAEELRQQVGDLEHELRGSLELRQRTDEDRSAHIASLEDQLRAADESHIQQIDDIVEETKASVQREADVERAKVSAVWCARVAGTQWAFVRDFAENELDAIKGDREILAALLTDLDAMRERALAAC
ncbi:hypothetical protein MIND_00446000 [Mycena indigotica]|uniref:Dol-P-Glc:Glc(2)Man(9)GlcNAc(2)-PP-Dol alpha-1,2-glucosyltransferase n=1 Tax=Mycena indigotica TaxID=2126181 RepID=A0A8H6SXC5_9AGAR|nr:uncharacterized protein MIND_00446000 [Mycena indigotica]KAF7306547.1 hypothetical protein MIND_00446000 [Mycena indigotica]